MDPDNGQVNENGFEPGNIATYTCNSGYSLSGQPTRECQNNGDWDGDAPTCVRKSMPYFEVVKLVYNDSVIIIYIH